MQHVRSHNRLPPSTWTVLTVREEGLLACSLLGQMAWCAAILLKEILGGMAAPQPHQLPRQEEQKRRISACLPAGQTPETQRAHLHRQPPSLPCEAWTVCRPQCWQPAMLDNCLHWGAVHGSETSARVLVSTWLVEGEVVALQHVPEVMYAPEQQAYSSLSKAEYFSARPTPVSWKRIHEAACLPHSLL
jgi:hypothetical protein